jgi:hypothetical protein
MGDPMGDGRWEMEKKDHGNTEKHQLVNSPYNNASRP